MSDKWEQQIKNLELIRVEDETQKYAWSLNCFFTNDLQNLHRGAQISPNLWWVKQYLKVKLLKFLEV